MLPFVITFIIVAKKAYSKGGQFFIMKYNDCDKKSDRKAISAPVLSLDERLKKVKCFDMLKAFLPAVLRKNRLHDFIL